MLNISCVAIHMNIINNNILLGTGAAEPQWATAAAAVGPRGASGIKMQG